MVVVVVVFEGWRDFYSGCILVIVITLMNTSFIPPRVKDLLIYPIVGHINPYYEILDFEKIREFFS